ncbi:MAG: hypothetical protein ABIN61_00395 [candidate division WOR-3 bacterium]
MRIAGVHIERAILVIREKERGKISFLRFQSLNELFKSREIKRCNEIYVNAGENNFLVKIKNFSNRDPEEAKNFVIKNLSEFTIGRGKDYITKVFAIPKGDGSIIYVVEGKEEEIRKRITTLPIENYLISGIIPDNFAIAYPFMEEEKIENIVLVVEIGRGEFIFTYLEDRKITFTRSVFYEEKEKISSLKKELDILLNKVGSVKKIYFTGDISDKEIKELKKDFYSYKTKIKGIYTTKGLPPEAILAYGLSLAPIMKFENDLTPKFLIGIKEERRRELRIKKFLISVVYFFSILISIPIFLLITGKIWIFVFNQRIDRLNTSYERARKMEIKVMKLKEKLRLNEEIRRGVSWGKFLFEISRCIPDDVCLLGLESEPKIEERKKGFVVNLIGIGKTHEAIMEFCSKIQDIGMVSEINIKKIKTEKGVINFDFAITLYSE